jgi:hypothetical protein
MRRRLEVPVVMLLCGVTVHVVGALLADLLWTKSAVRDLFHRGPTAFEAYLYITAFALAPLAAFAVIHLLLQRMAHRFVPVRRMLQAGTVAFPLLALAAQLESWHSLGSDSMAGLLFIFLPLYAGVAAAALMLLALLGSVLLGEHRRPALRR